MPPSPPKVFSPVENAPSSSSDAQRKAEEAGFLAAIVESSEDAIVGESINSAITSWNKGAERMFGYRRDEVIGRPISILHSEQDSEELERGVPGDL